MWRASACTTDRLNAASRERAEIVDDLLRRLLGPSAGREMVRPHAGRCAVSTQVRPGFGPTASHHPLSGPTTKNRVGDFGDISCPFAGSEPSQLTTTGTCRRPKSGNFETSSNPCCSQYKTPNTMTYYGGAGSLRRTCLWGRSGDFPVKQGKNREFLQKQPNRASNLPITC